MASEREHHLLQSQLSEDAKMELDRIAARLPPPNKWEDRVDGKVEAIKKEDVSEFQDDIVEIKKSCKVCCPLCFLQWYSLTKKQDQRQIRVRYFPVQTTRNATLHPLRPTPNNSAAGNTRRYQPKDQRSRSHLWLGNIYYTSRGNNGRSHHNIVSCPQGSGELRVIPIPSWPWYSRHCQAKDRNFPTNQASMKVPDPGYCSMTFHPLTISSGRVLRRHRPIGSEES